MPFFVEEKDRFPQYCCSFLSIAGQSYIAKAQSWQRGTFYALMGHLALHIRALIATTEPGTGPRESFFLPLIGHIVKRR